MFITLEGIDCSGKSTQAELLATMLKGKGFNVLLLREPGGTEVSEKIRDLLLHDLHLGLTGTAELFLFSAARTQLVSQVIRPALAAHKVVICDRFYDSTTAYQGFGRGLNLDDVARLNDIAVGSTHPDLTFLVDVTVEEVMRRQGSSRTTADRMESAGKEFFERVRNGFRSIAGKEPSRCVVLDGMQSVEKIHEQIRPIVQSRLSHSGA